MGKNDCKHPSSTWQEWHYSEGVTSGIMWRIKTCDSCGRTVDSQSKSV